MGNKGWIKIHRDLNNWEWRTSPKHLSVFMDLLVNANHKDNDYRGVTIKRGSLTTSYGAISARTGVSIKSVRTAIRDLKATNEITHVATRHYSIISITNWDSYQGHDDERAAKGQANGKLGATNKNVKNVKKKEMINRFGDLELIYKEYPKKVGKANGLKKLQSAVNSIEMYDKVMLQVKRYADSRLGLDHQFTRQFDTWVNQKGWDDDYKPTKDEYDTKMAEFLGAGEKPTDV